MVYSTVEDSGFDVCFVLWEMEGGGRARHFTVTDFGLQRGDHDAPSSLPRSNYMDDENGTNDTDGTTRPQLTNDCEVGRWFDDLMRLQTIFSENWTFNQRVVSKLNIVITT